MLAKTTVRLIAHPATMGSLFQHKTRVMRIASPPKSRDACYRASQPEDRRGGRD